MSNGSKPKIHGIYAAILNGTHERGTGGVLYVKGEECAYRFPCEFTNGQFQEKLGEILEEDGGANFYVVEERDQQLHILAYPKQVVEYEVACAMRAGQADRIEEVTSDGDAATSGSDPTTSPGPTDRSDLAVADPD